MPKQLNNIIDETKDYIKILPLGAAQEVGRSCFYIQFLRASFKSSFILDCGINPTISDGNISSEIPALPYFDLIDDSYPQIDFILISHYHTDHSMGLPHLIYQLQARQQLCPIYMSTQTKIETLKLLSQLQNQNKLFLYLPKEKRKAEAQKIIQLIDENTIIIDHDQTRIDNKTQIAIKALPAGHVEGACMFSLNINNYKILYTGDFSLEQGRSIVQARINDPSLQNCDLLITESTCGTISYQPREERKHILLKQVENSLMNGGCCLFPVFSVGIVDELVQMVVDYFAQNQQRFSKCHCVLCGIEQSQQLKNHLSDLSKQFIEKTNDRLPDIVPGKVYFAKPAMLQTGTSYEIFKKIASNQQSSLIITGYASQESYLQFVMDQANKRESTITFQDGSRSDFKLSVVECSFNAHADYPQLKQLIDSYKPKHTLLVHGSKLAGENILKKLRDEKYDVQQAVLGKQIAYQIDQGIIISSTKKLQQNQLNKFLIDQKGVKISIRQPEIEQLKLQIGLHYPDGNYNYVEKKLQYYFHNYVSKEQSKFIINSQIFDILFENVDNFKSFCQQQQNQQNNQQNIYILMYQNDKQEKLVHSGGFQYINVQVSAPNQLDYAQKILQLILNDYHKQLSISEIRDILGQGEIIDNNLIKLQNQINIKQRSGLWIIEGQENIFQISNDESNSQSHEQQTQKLQLEDLQQQKSQQPNHTLISPVKIMQDKQLYIRTFFPSNTILEKQNYISLSEQQYIKINQNINKKFTEIMNNTIDNKLKDNALQYIQEKVNYISEQIKLQPYGGSQNGLSSSTGDIDVTCLVSQSILQSIEKEWSQTCDKYDLFYQDQAIKLQEYVNSSKRFLQAYQQLQSSNNKQCIIDPEILKDRDDWQKIVFLIRLGYLFDQRCVCQVITKSKVPLLRLNLFYNKNTFQIVSPEEYYKPLREENIRVEHIKVLNVDLCVNNLLPLENTQLIGEYIKCYPQARQLILILKKFCKAREISFSYDSDNINSYSLVLLVIQYLQAIKLVPNLQETPKMRYVSGYNVAYNQASQSTKYFVQNNQIRNLAELLTGFFYFYGYLFQYENQIVSIRRGRILDQQEKQWKKQEQVHEQQIDIPKITQEISNQEAFSEIKNIKDLFDINIPSFITYTQNVNNFMQIEDPFETNLNTTRNMTYKAVKRLKTEFRRGYAVIKKHKGDCVDALFLSPKIDPPGIIPEQTLIELKQLQQDRDQNKNLEITIDQTHSNQKLQFSQKPE